MLRTLNNSVTAADIAKRVGVSRSTVSIVLRGHAKRRSISEKTTQQVLAVARELQYVPNHLATSLRRGRSGTIGVILGNLKADWAESVMEGMAEVLHASDYMPFITMHRGNSTLAERELNSCLRRCDEGIICLPLVLKPDLYERIQKAGVPLVFLGDRPQGMSGLSLVGWDSEIAACVAVNHLIETGRRRIAYLGIDYPMELAPARLDAYRKIVAEAGLSVEDRCVISVPTTWDQNQVVAHAYEQLFASGHEWPDAIYTVNDGLAIGLLEVLDSRGVRVPEDVAVIGMGDYPMTGHSMISLSTVKEPCEEMGRQAAQTIIDLIREPGREPICRLIPGHTLKVRRTTRPRSS